MPIHSSYLVLLLLCIPWASSKVYLSPFFFLCNYHGNTQNYGLNKGEVVISVQVEGNPQAYVPGNFYQISISSSENFDSFLMTGLYTTTANTQPSLTGQFGIPVSTGGQNLMCSIVHSQVSPHPMKTLTFVWSAPPSGTGCVNFLATATHGQQLLFKDTTVLQLCEQGAISTSLPRPVLAEINSDSVLMRDDFETSDFNPEIWQTVDGGHIGDECGTVVYGQSAVLCDSAGAIRDLVTVPLNLTSAHVLQFSLGGGGCRTHFQPDPDIIIAYGINDCSKWVEIERFKAPAVKNSEVHIVSLPLASRSTNICLKFFQPSILPDANIPFSVVTHKVTETGKPTIAQTSSHSSTPSVTTSQSTYRKTQFEVKTKPWEKQSSSTTVHFTKTTSSTTPSTTSEATTTSATTTTAIVANTTGVLETTSNSDQFINGDFYNFSLVLSDEAQGDQSIDRILYHGCWAIDNIVVVNTANTPNKISDSLDPIDPSNWIFFPGAHVEHQCQSYGNAFVFEDRNQTSTYAVTRDLNLDISDVQTDAVFSEDFDSPNNRLSVENGHRGTDCGVLQSGNSLVFNGQKKRQTCTELFEQNDVASVRFYFQFGGGNCSASEKSPSVLMYLEDEQAQTLGLRTLSADTFTTSQLVSYPIVNSTTKIKSKGKIRLCLLQKSHGGQGKDVWAIDDLALMPLMPNKSKVDVDKVLQARVNLECGPGTDENSVTFEYSTDHGASWHDFYTPCLPPSCNGNQQMFTSVLTSQDLMGWNRVTLPIPYAAQSPYVRFRSVHHGPVSTPWAIDDIYIGACADWCNGHGSCVESGCSCDFGFEGDQCEKPVFQPASTLHENFEDPTLITSSILLDVTGGTIGYDCGVVSSGKALVFHHNGARVLRTTDVNTTSVRSIQFTLRIGSPSVTSRCPSPDAPSENVLLEATCHGGIRWILLEEFSPVHFQRPRSTTISLPESARGEVCQFRWRQPQNSGYGQDVWAIDDIHFSPEGSANLLTVEMMDMPDLDSRLVANLGKLVDSFCERMRSITFSSKEKNGEPRLLRSKDMNVGPGYIAQFDLVMGCGVPYTEGLDNQIHFQYSVDHGITWHLVEEPCLPPDVCEEYRPGTIYHHSQFENWVTVTVILSQDTWNQQTMFRWMQPDWSETDVWGVNRVYIGYPCPDLCHGHGTCQNGVCRCDQGFSGSENCLPDHQADTSIQADFGHRYNPKDDFIIKGGKVVRSDEGCGIILSGENMYFSQNGVRELLTKNLDTDKADFIQFYIQIGGEGKACQGADKRKESVLLRYSTNGGITWHLLEELHHLEHRKPTFIHRELPLPAKSPHTVFQWWQPSHSGEGNDQWAVDEILIGQYKNFKIIEDSFDVHLDPIQSDDWRVITEGTAGKYCGSESPSLVMSNQVNDKLAVTNDVQLHPGDVIQFEINVDCGKIFRWDHPVIFQYSHDHGQSWHLVEDPCYLDQDCDGKLTEGSIYYTGTHGQWSLVVIPVTDKIATHPAIFRWWQLGGVHHSFSIDNVYMGPPCIDNCHRQGLCRSGNCECYETTDGVLGDNCSPVKTAPTGMLDRFDNKNMPSMIYWDRILGGHLGRACGTVDYDNALYFGGDGTREAVTVPLNTTQKKIMEFAVKIGDNRNSESCRVPRGRNEGIVVDYSTDNGITWQVLKVVEPSFEDITPSTVVIELPLSAKQERTIFRFWQPLGLGDMPRAEWALDSVMVGVNETSDYGFEDTFDGRHPDPHNWFLADSAVQRETCNSNDNALEFSNKNGLQQAETWDYQVTPSTFLQFDLAMNCGSLPSDLYSIRVDYSIDHGQTWIPVINECKPPNFECSGYHLSSSYSSDQFPDFRRVTVALPEGAVSPATRIRWLRPKPEQGNNIWALDNVYLGDECPWLCSGHGFCHQGKCHCDQGFSGDFCVPHDPLPMAIRDDFNSEKSDNSVWKEIYGGGNSHMCGSVVTGRSLTFNKDGLRMAVTQDMDTTMLVSAEFHFKYGCGSEAPFWPRNQSVLLQYSVNGGIIWKLLKEIHFSNTSAPKFYTLLLPSAAKHNATRFRFWQAANEGEMRSVWSVDNLFIGTMAMNPGSVVDNFETDEPDPMSWIFVNDGTVDEYCSLNTRSLTDTGVTSLVFRRGEGGELSALSSDLEIGPMSILQFDINVGCGAEPTSKYPVRLEYSTDGGSTWSLVGPNCVDKTTASCFESTLPTTIYYAGDSLYWQRKVVPLDHLHVCGTLRFRWYQGKIPDTDFGPEWALDNVYIGMACPDNCNGHGYCLGGILCQCDPGYTGATCVAETAHHSYLRDDFDIVDVIIRPKVDVLLPSSVSDSRLNVNEKNWQYWSSGHPANHHRCGKVFTGANFVHDKEGQRTLTTVPLDLSKANLIQFYLKLGCNNTVTKLSPPVFLQYSTNGGITWTTMEQFDFNPDSNKPKYIAAHIPLGAQTNITQIRWWQPSRTGKYDEDWAIDQVYIGGKSDGEDILQDEPGQPLNTTWLEYPGAKVQPFCKSDGATIHFKEKEPERYAITADVMVRDGSILQFELAMACETVKGKDQQCYDIILEYSLDMGKTWRLLRSSCFPSMNGCGSYHASTVFTSDVYTGWHRVTVPIPKPAWSTQTRFRIYQVQGFSSDQSWAVQSLYIGSTCPNRCRGHGRCVADQCVCDEHWNGTDCSLTDEHLPTILVEDFLGNYKKNNWDQIVGGSISQPCRLVSAGDALHFKGPCSRLLQTKPLDLQAAMLIQFYFLYGCVKNPTKRDEGVILEFSTDHGITWQFVTEMHYNLYRTPTFVSLKLPGAAKTKGTILRWWQPVHGRNQESDWLIDGIRINGEEINPVNVTLNFTSGFEFLDLITADNMEIGTYCSKEGVAIGQTKAYEPSTLSSRDVKVSDHHILQFSINVGCGKPWNYSVQPVNIDYSTDHGITWTDLVTHCLNEMSCQPHWKITAAHYHGLHDSWRRITIPLYGLPVSNGTRFRWQQLPGGMPGSQDWALGDIYIGPACKDNCHGHGFCLMEECICDDDFGGDNCHFLKTDILVNQLKDSFDTINKVNETKWPWLQNGNVLIPCRNLVQGPALVFSGVGTKEVVTSNLDLRDARFVQYTAFMWSKESPHNLCSLPPDHKYQSVFLQYSTDGGISWQTLHTLSPQRYWPQMHDYISLPIEARTNSTIIRWIQAEAPPMTSPRISWALDDVYIGGWEINPSVYHQTFDVDEPGDDPAAWEFSPNGVVEGEGGQCFSDGLSGSAMMWPDTRNKDGSEQVQKFTTNQMIVQPGYMLQFKMIIGCGRYGDICSAPDSVIKLDYRRNPSSEAWEAVLPSCLPSSQNGGLCNPHQHHHASHYVLSQFLTWTRVTIPLSEVTFSSSTQFRWVQTGQNGSISWALDDIYIGEKCEEMCSGRGDCIQGACHCDAGYSGPSCLPDGNDLLSRLFDSFEGGIFTSHWQTISGGGIGFGCGALLPYAHGKTLYFNECGDRQAVTVELDTLHAIKIIFVIQIGCYAQTDNCNVNLAEGPNYRGVLLQYSKNKGAEWFLIAQHDPADFLRPKRVAYEIPQAAKGIGTQFRWWQPVHDGHGHDQWAIDHVEIISGRKPHRRGKWKG